MDHKEVLHIDFQDSIISLTVGAMPIDIDIDQCTFIDYNNLFLEIITTGVLINRFGLLRAEAERNYTTADFDLDILKAKLSEEIRIEKAKPVLNAKKEEVFKAPTEGQIENHVLMDASYQRGKRKLFRLKSEWECMKSACEALKAKDFKLPKLLEYTALVPIEHEAELVVGKYWNGVFCQMREKLIK